jgi:hypothetical protein
MHHPATDNVAVLQAVIVIVSLAMAAPAAQTSAAMAKKTTAAPRTAWGDPDLQGRWNNTTMTPLERPNQFAGKAVLSEEEAAGFQRQELERNNADRRDGASRADVDRAYNEMWFDRGKLTKTMRTSLVIDPSDGRIPPFTPEGQQREAARLAARQQRGPADSWEDRTLTERCILNHGVPPLPTGYNNNYQILQIPGYVVILYEMLYEPRIIPIGGSRQDGSHVRQWKGNSRGRWDGNTLIVDTTDFSEQTTIRGITAKPSEALHIVERFTRVDADTIDYQATLDDPRTWSRSWTVAVPMRKTDDRLYEYACHEGNYGMVGILAGARADEKAGEAEPGKR